MKGVDMATFVDVALGVIHMKDVILDRVHLDFRRIVNDRVAAAQPEEKLSTVSARSMSKLEINSRVLMNMVIRPITGPGLAAFGAQVGFGTILKGPQRAVMPSKEKVHAMLYEQESITMLRPLVLISWVILLRMIIR